MDELEGRVMELLLAGDEPPLAALRVQYASCSIERREFSGVGFFTHFRVHPDSPRSEPASFRLGDVHLVLDGLQHDAGVVLFVEGGVLSFLEGFTYAEPWPKCPRLRSVHYLAERQLQPNGFALIPSLERDPGAVRRALAGEVRATRDA